MIIFKDGNIFKQNTEAIVNTVNCVGVMGKGLALQFKNKYPLMFNKYKKDCEFGYFKPGWIDVYDRLKNEGESDNPRFLINFPTKMDWRNPSKYEYIDLGLNELKNVIEQYNIKSISIPALGCENGGLDWKEIRIKILNVFIDISDRFIIVVLKPKS